MVIETLKYIWEDQADCYKSQIFDYNLRENIYITTNISLTGIKAVLSAGNT